MFKYRGVIEGFYGMPWSHEERLGLLEWMSKEGYTHFMYAPKADAYHRAKWREPYPKAEISNFTELIDKANKSGIVFGIAISPGLSMIYSSNEDREILYQKLLGFVDLGVRFIGLFFDDIPLEIYHPQDKEKYFSLAQSQVDLTNGLFERLRNYRAEVELIFCPTVYCGIGDDEYLAQLGEGLHPEINIFWTGPQICSPKIEPEDLGKVVIALKRKPIIWDNYPVNDAMMNPELHIGPYTGRGTELLNSVGGFFINPMNQLNASLITLYAISEYLKNPVAYDPWKAWERGIKLLVGEELTEDFLHFACYNLISPIHTFDDNPYGEIWRKGNYLELDGEIREMMRVSRILEENIMESSLGREIKPWLQEFKFYARLGERSIKVDMGLRDLFQLTQKSFSLKLITTFWRLQLALNHLKRMLKKVPGMGTAVTGDLVYGYSLKTFRSVDGLLKIYLDKGSWVYRLIRRILMLF